MPEVTVVTGLWDIGRGALAEGWARPYGHYLDRLRELLGAFRQNLIVFGDAELRGFVEEHRGDTGPVFFVERPLAWFRNEFYDQIQAIRTDEAWRARAGWLGESVQARLEWYNPIVLAKPFLLNDARLLDPFGSTHLLWLDAGLTNTVPVGYLDSDVLANVGHFDRVTFAAFPYAAEAEVHGFEFGELCALAGGTVTDVCRGGVFGGPAAAVEAFSAAYYPLLQDTLTRGFMGTEESLFSVLAKAAPERYAVVPIAANGLVYPFFDALREGRRPGPAVALYVLTFNSPRQLEALFASFDACDGDFLRAPDVYVIDNSTEPERGVENASICAARGVTHLPQDNVGINGGRQLAADHAHDNGYDFHFFFEDDMTLCGPDAPPCRNGFPRYAPNLYSKCLAIAERGQFDFVKLSFSEFFGDNHAQWAWYNVPGEFRERRWPEVAVPDQRLADERLPRTRFERIESYEGVAYARGEVFYCNWPQLVSRAGNERMFRDTRWAHPYEQTWMSHFFQETVAGRLHPGILLLSPVEHDRFEHYAAEERREN